MIDERNESEEFFELPDRELKPDDEELNPDEAEVTGTSYEVICICEECNNRWDDIVGDDESDGEKLFCPLCGSQNVLEL